MTSISLRPSVATSGLLRAFALVALVLTFGVFMAEPAYAFDAFGSAITDKTTQATSIAIKILQAAAVLALIVGLAPMLWGQIKVKWIVTGLSACVLFGLTAGIVGAFVTK